MLTAGALSNKIIRMKTPFIPAELPPRVLDINRFVQILGEANRALSRYDGMVHTIINPDVLLSPFITEEATQSSMIEGTLATVDDVYACEAGVNIGGGKEADIVEIENYRKALEYASASIGDRPFSLGLIKECHRLLLDGVRGSTKTPGEFRQEQNWIGRPGATMENATFVPPSPLIVQASLDSWMRYLQTDHVDPLVQSAIMHAQFEIIHPFLDGNGRIGRLMIPLFLYVKGVLHRPMFYLSAYLEAHRDEYYARLHGVHEYGEWEEWIKFFLRAIDSQAKENVRRSAAIIRLYEDLKEQFRQATHSEHAQKVQDAIFTMPTFTIPKMVERLKECPATTARSLLNKVVQARIVELRYEASGRRPAVYRLASLLDIASGRDVAGYGY